jgi:ABC-type transport system involved in multi-copper enzyme maturation permease subunit
MKFLGMVWYTLNETLRKGTLLFYASVGLIIVLFFAFGLTRSQTNPNAIMIFGRQFTESPSEGISIIDFFLVMLHRQASSSMLLFGVFGVAGLIPSLLEKGTVEIFLSKPLNRPLLLFARSMGATIAMALNLVGFTFFVWLIIGLRLDTWNWGFLWSGFLSAYSFACFFSVITFIGLTTRSTGISVMLAFMFALISTGLESRENGLYLLWTNSIYHRVLDVLYYSTPQLEGMSVSATAMIAALPISTFPSKFQVAPFVFSFASSIGWYGLSAWYFSRQDF